MSQGNRSIENSPNALDWVGYRTLVTLCCFLFRTENVFCLPVLGPRERGLEHLTVLSNLQKKISHSVHLMKAVSRPPFAVVAWMPHVMAYLYMAMLLIKFSATVVHIGFGLRENHAPIAIEVYQKWSSSLKWV